MNANTSPTVDFHTQIATIKRALDDRKGDQVVALDIQGVSESLSYFVIATGTSTPHLDSLERHVRDEMFDHHGIKPIRVEGPSARWVLVDFGAIIVHVMTAEAREYYDLEGFWADGQPV